VILSWGLEDCCIPKSFVLKYGKTWRIFGATGCPVFRESAASIFRIKEYSTFSTPITFSAVSSVNLT
jgi:hypothetical protein